MLELRTGKCPLDFRKRWQNLLSSCSHSQENKQFGHSCAAMTKKFAKKHNACAELLVCSLHCKPITFLKFPVAFAIVVCQGPYYRSNTTPETKVKITLFSEASLQLRQIIFCLNETRNHIPSQIITKKKWSPPPPCCSVLCVIGQSEFCKDLLFISTVRLGFYHHVSHTIFQGAKRVIFKACHSGKLKLEFTSPNVISTSPKSILMGRSDFTVLL